MNRHSTVIVELFTHKTLITAIPHSMVINTRKLWGVTQKVQLITMGTLITMNFQMVLISWVYIWPQNRPKRSLSNLSWNFWVFPVTSSGRNGKQKGGECFCFGNFLALFVLPSLLCAHSAHKPPRERNLGETFSCAHYTLKKHKRRNHPFTLFS